MTPYLAAHAAYHACGAQAIAWGDALDFHLQRGIVLNTWDLFVMARPVPPDLPPAEELDLLDFGLTGHVGGHWHVWAAAGDLAGLASLCQRFRIERLRFQRHGTQRIHDIDGRRFMRRASRA